MRARALRTAAAALVLLALGPLIAVAANGGGGGGGRGGGDNNNNLADQQRILRQQVFLMQDQIDSLRNDIRYLEREVDSLNGEIADLGRQFDLAQQALPPAQLKADTAARDLSVARQAAEAARQAAAKAQKDLAAVDKKLKAAIDTDDRMVQARQAVEQTRQQLEAQRMVVLREMLAGEDYRKAIAAVEVAGNELKKLDDDAITEVRIAAASKVLDRQSVVSHLEQTVLDADATHKQTKADADAARKAMTALRVQLEQAIAQHPDHLAAAQARDQAQQRVAPLLDRLATTDAAYATVALALNGVANELQRLRTLADLKINKRNQDQNNLNNDRMGLANLGLQQFALEQALFSTVGNR